jgi:hypothetical protein
MGGPGERRERERQRLPSFKGTRRRTPSTLLLAGSRQDKNCLLSLLRFFLYDVHGKQKDPNG